MFGSDVLNMLLGTVISGVLGLMKARMEQRRQELDLMMQRQGLADSSADKAALRGGPIVRRFIAIVVVGYLFLAPIVLKLLRPEVPVIYAYPEAGQAFMWFFRGVEQLKFVEMDGFVVLPFQRDLAAMIAGFYFGAGIVKR